MVLQSYSCFLLLSRSQTFSTVIPHSSTNGSYAKGRVGLVSGPGRKRRTFASERNVTVVLCHSMNVLKHCRSLVSSVFLLEARLHKSGERGMGEGSAPTAAQTPCSVSLRVACGLDWKVHGMRLFIPPCSFLQSLLDKGTRFPDGAGGGLGVDGHLHWFATPSPCRLHLLAWNIVYFHANCLPVL